MRHSNNLLRYILLLGIVLKANLVFADVIVLEDLRYYGKILKMNNSIISFSRACNKRDILTIKRKDVSYILFDSKCSKHNFTFPTAGLQAPCEKEKILLYKINFKEKDQWVFASSISMKDDNIVLDLVGQEGSLSGKKGDILSISNVYICPNSIPSIYIFPKNYCFEPKHFAINWSTAPIFNNTIFTKGFTFYIDRSTLASQHVDVETITQGIREALFEWVAPLMDIKDSLEPKLKHYITSSIAVSDKSKYQVLIAPQVVSVECKCNAMFIINLTDNVNSIFEDNGYLAKAQVRGRTIFINFLGFNYIFDLSMKEYFINGKINLVTVLCHELGHSFGLTHRKGIKSIMNPDDMNYEPTQEDIQKLIAILRENIKGERAGVFNERDCSGLKSPVIQKWSRGKTN